MVSFHQVVVSMVVKLEEVSSVSLDKRPDFFLILDQWLVHRVVKGGVDVQSWEVLLSDLFNWLWHWAWDESNDLLRSSFHLLGEHFLALSSLSLRAHHVGEKVLGRSGLSRLKVTVELAVGFLKEFFVCESLLEGVKSVEVDCHDDVDCGKNWAESQMSFVVVMSLLIVELMVTMVSVMSMVSMFTMFSMFSVMVFSVVFTILVMFTVMAMVIVLKVTHEVLILVVGLIPKFVTEHSIGLSSSIPSLFFKRLRNRINHWLEIIIEIVKDILIKCWWHLACILKTRVLVHELIDQVLNFGIVHITNVNIQVDILAINQRLIVQD